MAYTPQTLGLWRFNSTLYDAVANNNFVLNNDDPYTVGPPLVGSYSAFSRFDLFQNAYENIYGLDLSNDAEYEAEFISYVAGEFTIGFWMNTTTALGFVRHAVTRNKEPKTSPIFAKAEKATVDGQEIFEDAAFAIIEEAVTETTNRIVLLLSSDGVTISNRINSASYSVGLHHYLIVYDSPNARARIDVDGSLGSWNSAPSSVCSTTSTLKLNAINPNYIVHQAIHTGAVLRDLYFKDESTLTDEEAIRNMKYGVLYVTDADLVDVKFENFAFSFAQPNTIATNAIVASGSTIYLGQSNGNLLKGEQPIWDNDYTFDSIEKIDVLKKSQVGTIAYSDSEEGLYLNGGFVII